MDDLSRAHLTWLERQHDRSPNTIASRARVLRAVGNAGTSTREELEAWWEARAEAVATGTRAVDLSHLREFYRWCAMYDHRADDPTVRIRAPKVGNANHRKVANHEVVRLADKMPADLRRAVLLGAFAGLRVSESAALDWGDVDTIEDVVIVRRGKGGKSRAVPVSPDLIRRLATDGTTGNVVSAGGQPPTGAALQRRLNRAMRGAGAEFTSHDLRHRWGLTAYRASHDLLAVAEMMGHSSVNTTKIYASADSETKRKIAAAVMI
jgi:site-specific recombinase XerD